MEIAYYGFAFFIFVLVCAVMLLGKYLFSDIKRQNKLLDEKETKLLRLYQTVEETMEEFFDEVSQAKSELKAMDPLRLPGEENVQERPPKPPKQTGEGKSAQTPEPPRFQHIIDELVDGELDISEEPADAPKSRKQAILALWREGKENAQIAETLGITKTEVELILGLNGSAQGKPKDAS